ncbi:MAG: hypothetical protein JWM91_3484 [Rhodospirillales bacterium]|nr:hypothetical protein [Rhodospirillales bacterium]
MATMLDFRAAAIAAIRFGFGAKQGELADIAPDPRGWLEGQLIVSDTVPNGTPSSAQLAAYLQARREKKTDVDLAKMFQRDLREDFKTAIIQRTLGAAASTTPFCERLVQFWSNHFTVSIQRPIVIPVAVGFENEAIRPHVLGKFRDMLQAAAAHPAMLLYLDNAQSVGPNSIGGRVRDKGLNENLAREALELHTVGVDGGYTQTDVTEFAKILTGWSIARENDPNPGTFRWRPAIHEPGAKSLLGRTYREDGVDEGVAALNDLAERPETAYHIATKLVRHFVADDPPQAAIDKIAATFRSTDGDLHAVSLALIDLPQIWAQPLTKIKTPNDLVISAYRAFGIANVKFGDGMIAGLRLMGQVPFNAPSPAGWADTADGWVSPEAMMTRIQWALAAGQKLDGHADALEIAKGLIQPVATDSTMFHIENAPSPAEALALLIASPEFQRR